MSTEDHTRRVAVITGASSGIGEATARALATTGHRLALLARRADRIKALATELGNGAIAITADVTDRDALVDAAERPCTFRDAISVPIVPAAPHAAEATMNTLRPTRNRRRRPSRSVIAPAVRTVAASGSA